MLINTGRAIEPLEASLDGWQRADYEAADPGWLRMVTGQGEGKLRFYFERPRGHSKTTDQAVMAGWALYASTRPLVGIAAAGKKDQAKLLRDGLACLVRQNDWLAESIEVNNYQAINRRTGSKLDIISSEEKTNYGHTPDFVVVDELTVWPGRGLWDALFSAAAKKPSCLFLVISNAGYGKGTSWQWKLREKCRAHPSWHFSRLDGPQASWITEENLAEQQSLLLGQEYQRVWLNTWTVESGDCIAASDVDACTVCRGPVTSFTDHLEPFIAGLDLAIKKHHAALVVLGVNSRLGKVQVVECRSWDPKKFPNGEISLSEVHEAVRDARRRYKLWTLCYDPTQAAYMIQMLRQDAERNPSLAMRTKEMRGTKDNSLMAVKLVDAFKNRRIELYDDKALRNDLLRLSIIEKQHGFSIVAPADETGHADRAMALAMALPTALEFAEDLHLNPISRPPVTYSPPPVPPIGQYYPPGPRRWLSV